MNNTIYKIGGQGKLIKGNCKQLAHLGCNLKKNDQIDPPLKITL